jgi:hypothetical protein
MQTDGQTEMKGANSCFYQFNEGAEKPEILVIAT